MGTPVLTRYGYTAGEWGRIVEAEFGFLSDVRWLASESAMGVRS
jgi:hypothetical protein